jgi:hypothetical protein
VSTCDHICRECGQVMNCQHCKPYSLPADRARIAELEAALRSVRLTSRVLLQNAEGCAVNHYGVDYSLHGEPGWLADCRKSIEAAEVALRNSPEGVPI